jgi:hypothetical protein
MRSDGCVFPTDTVCRVRHPGPVVGEQHTVSHPFNPSGTIAFMLNRNPNIDLGCNPNSYSYPNPVLFSF